MSLNEEYLITLVKNMKIKDDQKNTKNIIDKINMCDTLTKKCILVREYLSPQSTIFEKIIKKDLLIEPPINNTSGDGCKNNKNYEIKASVHAKKSKINWVQIRPDHNIDFYILIAYNIYENDNIGKAYIFKIPSDLLYDLIVKYGGYAHGTCGVHNKITIENIKGRNCEYALRCNPNVKKGKNHDLWNELLKYEVEYDSNNF
jgi:hypothetical protein